MTGGGFTPRELTAADVERITDAQAGVEQDAIVVRPHRDNSGILGMDDVLRSLPRAETETGRLRRREQNVSPPFAYEMRYAPDPVAGTGDERVISLQYVGGTDHVSSLLDRQLADKYPDSRTERRAATWLTPDEGQHMAVATLGLRRYTLYPLKNVDLDEFRADPTGSILTEMVGAAEADGIDADVAVQIMVRPAGTDWQDGVPGGYGLAEEYGEGYTATEDKVTKPYSTQKLRWSLNQDTHERQAILPTPIGTALGWAHPFFRDEFTHAPSKADKQAAKMLSDLDGRGWGFHVRVVAVSDSPDLAQERVETTAAMFDNFYEYRGAQTFLPIPKQGTEAVSEAVAAAGREWPTDPAQRMVKPQIEVAGLVNIPEAEHVSTNKMRWSLAKPGDGVPPGTPRFDREVAGLPATASDEQMQLAMLDDDGTAGDGAYWYGLGSKHGVETGVFSQHMDVPQFVNGGTGTGKTTFLTNRASQSFHRKEGGLIIDPKGMDADEFIAEWPEDRPEEDFICFDLGDDDERIPRFNFLEIPDMLEPGTRAHASYVEALADDLTAMVAEAGGADNYLGALMKRVTKTLVRGLAKSDRTCTLLDLAVAASSAENLGTFRQWMDDERIEFIRETARRLEEKDDTDLEPLAGRMDEWIHNEAIRDLIAARNPSFSIQEAVEENKVIVVRFPTGAGKTEKKLLTAALIRRTYCTQRWLARKQDTVRPFNLICDECDKVLGAAGMPTLLSEARAFKYRTTLACQNPSNQLPDRLKHAVANQCETWVSFNPGGGKAGGFISQQHSPEIGSQEMTDLPKFSFYFRTHDKDDNLTPSFMVDAFPPVREVRSDVDGIEPRSGEEMRALKRRSLDRYGDVPESAGEQQAASPFLGGEQPDKDAAPDTEDTDHQRTLCKAVYDAALRAEDDGLAWVGAGAVRDRLARYTDTEWTGAQFGALCDQTPEVTYRDSADAGEQCQCSEEGRERIMPAGDNQTEGGLSHRALLRDAYDPLTQLGLEIELPEQGGGAESDGIGHIRESFAPDVDPWSEPAKFAEALETFREEHPDLAALTDAQNVTLEAESSTSGKPAATCENLVKAVASDRRCLFLARPERAQTVFKTLSSPPYLHSSPEDADRRFYNRKRLQVNGERPLRPNTAEQTRWREFGGEIVLEDNEGDEHARFDSPGAIFESLGAYPAHTGMDEIDDEDIGRDGEWRPIAKPWIPELEFEGAVPGTDAWRLLVVERDGTLRNFETNGVLYGDAEGEDTDTDEPEEDADTDETESSDGWSTLTPLGEDGETGEDDDTGGIDEDDPWAHLSYSGGGE